MPSSGSITPLNGSAITFAVFRGFFHGMGQEIEEITRPNVDGHGFRQRALRALSADFISVRDAATKEEVESIIATYLAAQGKVATVVDARGTSHANVIIEKVVIQSVMPATTVIGGITASPPAQFIIMAAWQMKPTDIP